jgi:anti-sigma regulatory factor (Ser/Thr protein kinase)
MPARLRHDAFVYGSETEFAERMVPFLEAGLEQDESTVAVTTRENCTILRDALGRASERVSFVDRDEWYVRPANVIAGYDKTLRERLLGGAPAVRVVGEVQFGATPQEWDEWTAYESILNRAFAGQPAWIVCPYDARALPDTVLQSALKTHPHCLADKRYESPHYDDPAHVVRAMTPEPAPLTELRGVALGDGRQALREQLGRKMAAAGVPLAKADDLILAASEVVANALRHGDGRPELRVGVVDGRFVCEVADRGRGLDDPLAGYVPPRPDRPCGAGLWVARQLTSRLELLTTPGGGLTTRLWA